MRTFSFLFLLLIFGSSCRTVQKNIDRREIKYALRHQEQLLEAASLAIAETYESRTSHLELSKISDQKLKKQLGRFGTRITVDYNKSSTPDIPDSIVTFTTYSLWGVTEIVYDFAAIDRSFTEYPLKQRPFYFKKIAPRIYFRRREFPMM